MRIEQTVLIWHAPCRRFISREDSHPCDITPVEYLERQAERRIYVDELRAKKQIRRDVA